MPRLEEDYIYHVYNRGVDKREIFSCDNDRRRFISCLYFYNDLNSAKNITRLVELTMGTQDERDKLVEILAFVLMPNHFHLLLKPVAQDGISEFMKKIGIGYTHYFNIKYDRTGCLFQGKYKHTRIDTEEQLQYIPFYIHFNPLGLINPDWKQRTLENFDRSFDFLKTYPWSSLGEYVGNSTNYSMIIDKSILSENFGKPKELMSEIKNWLKTLI